MKKIKILLLTLLVSALHAQDDFYSMDEEVFEISAFEVSSGSSRGYDPRFRGGNLSSNPIRVI